MNISSNDQIVFSKQGFGAGLRWQPPAALLLVDFVNGFCKSDVFGGHNIDAAVGNTVAVLSEFRRRGLPVVFTRIVFKGDGSDENIFCEKVPTVRLLTQENPDSHVVDLLKPLSGELVVNKTVPSSFSGTALTAFLTQHGIKTLVIGGATTSGCVRATVVDAMSLGFRPFVLADCVGDRVESAHVMSLRDMQMKYAEVIDSQDLFKRMTEK